MAWLLHQPAVSSIIIGATKLHQLEDNLKAVDVFLTEDELNQFHEVSNLSAEYPANVLEVMTIDRSAGIDFLNA